MSNLDKIKELLDAKLEALIQTKQQEFVQNSLTAESVPDNEINNKDERRKVSTALQKKAGDATVGGVKSKHGTASINVKSANEEVEDTEEDLDSYSIEEIQEFIESEEYESLDEVSKELLGRYIKKATASAAGAYGDGVNNIRNNDKEKSGKAFGKFGKRYTGISKAVDKLTK